MIRDSPHGASNATSAAYSAASTTAFDYSSTKGYYGTNSKVNMHFKNPATAISGLANIPSPAADGTEDRIIVIYNSI